MPSVEELRAAAQELLDAEAEPAYSWVIESEEARREGRPNREVERMERISRARRALRAALASAPTPTLDVDDDPTARALLDQPLVSVDEDGDHEHTGRPCRTCVVMGASVTVDDIERALPYGDFDRLPAEDFMRWRRRFAALLHARLARPARLTSSDR